MKICADLILKNDKRRARFAFPAFREIIPRQSAASAEMPSRRQTVEQKGLQNKFPAECFTPSSIGIAFVARAD